MDWWTPRQTLRKQIEKSLEFKHLTSLDVPLAHKMFSLKTLRRNTGDSLETGKSQVLSQWRNRSGRGSNTRLKRLGAKLSNRQSGNRLNQSIPEAVLNLKQSEKRSGLEINSGCNPASINFRGSLSTNTDAIKEIFVKRFRKGCNLERTDHIWKLMKSGNGFLSIQAKQKWIGVFFWNIRLDKKK